MSRRLKIRKSEEQREKEFILRRDKKNTKLIFSQVKAINELGGLPKPNEQIRLVTEMSYNAFSYILNVLEERPKIDEMFLAVYRINEWTLDNLMQLIDAGKIKNPTFVISRFFRALKNPEKWALKLTDYCQKRNIPYSFIDNHAKVILLKIDKDYYVFEGSGNLSDNGRIEQYVIENNEEIYNFHKNWMIEYSGRQIGNKEKIV